jgi:hypothetical protein
MNGVMANVEQTKSTSQSTQPIEKLYMENTLLRVSGALFCHDPKRASTRTEEFELSRGVADKKIVIRPDPRLGQPGPLAHKIFVALLKKHSDYGRPIREDVSFTRKEIGRLIGRKDWGGSDSRDLHRALYEIYYAHIIAHFKNGTGRYVERPFKVFSNILIEREQFANDPIVACSVTIDPHIITSLRDDHFICLNHTLMQQLGTIGQALYMRLFFHFANLYDGHHKTRLAFPKRYDDICSEWLGGLTVHKHKSIIERDQLGSHLRQLVQAGFLSSYQITEASTDGHVITFRPGIAFFTDYDRFYRNRHQGELQWEYRDDRREHTEPLKVAYLFMEKRTGQPLAAIPYISTKDKDTAKQLLGQVNFEEMPDFLDYALAEAKKTKFDVQSLGGLKQYLAGFLRTRGHRATSQEALAKHRAKEQEEAALTAYDKFRRLSADTLFATLPGDEQAIIEGLARARSGGPFAATSGSLAATIFGSARIRITAERHSDKIPTLEQWTLSRSGQERHSA